MTDQLLTKCPHCGTTFKLSHAQLNTAQGAVRCGACLQVFHANEYIIDGNNPDLDPDLAQLSSEIDELSGDQDPFSYAPPPTQSSISSNDDVLANLDAMADDIFHSDDEIDFSQNKQSNDDEAWAEALLRELDAEDKFEAPEIDAQDQYDNTQQQPVPENITDTPEQEARYGDEDPIISSNDDLMFDLDSEDDFSFKSGGKGDDFTESFKSFSVDEHSVFNDLDSDEEEYSGGGADESWAQAMLAELEDESKVEPPSRLTLQGDDDHDDRARSMILDELPTKKHKPAPPPKKEDDLFSEEFDELLNDGDKDLFSTDEVVDLLGDEVPEPNAFQTDFATDTAVHLDAFGETRKKQTGLFIGGLILNILMASVLVAQYSWYNFESLARDKTYRPYLTKVCNAIHCTMPAQQDVSQIRGTNLVVRSHPSEPNALVVDAIVRNQANFDQPFPMLELSFSDINGTVKARRAFYPDEYRLGELAKYDQMPSKTPIHLSLEIVDPGPDAINYEIKFAPVPNSSDT